MSADPLTPGIGCDAIKQAQVVTAEKKRKSAKDGEGGVNASPEHWYLTDGTSDEREKKDADAADETEVDDPAIADRIAIGSEEEEGKEDAREGKPIGAVGEKGRGGGGRGERAVNAEDPGKERRASAEVDRAGEMIEEPLRLMNERKEDQAAEQKASHNDGETKADSRDEV